MNEEPDDSFAQDYFGLFEDEAVAGGDLELTPEPLPPPKKNRLPDPVLDPTPPTPPRVVPELSSPVPNQATKRPFVAKKKAIPGERVPGPARKQSPPPARKLPANKQPAKPKAPPATAKAAAKVPAVAPGPSVAKNRWLASTLALTWLAIGVCAYFLWQHHQALASQKQTAPDPNPEQEVSPAEDDPTAALATKIAELEALRELKTWGDEAIAYGHRSALYKLDNYFERPEIRTLKEAANAEIIRVESYFITTRRYRGFPDEMPYISETDPVASLERILHDTSYDWTVRARAATLLGDQEKDPRAAGALAKASHTDTNLYVVQESILAFAKVTGFRSNGVFDSESVKDWWDEKSASSK